MGHRAALAVLVFSALLFSGSLPADAHSEKGATVPEIGLLEIDGVINPLTARYLARELKNSASAELIIVRLDTPGGLETSMREMTRAMLGSPVPIVVYVSPSGARAASAGMFLTIAAHVAAMAPGTTIGAAHPVGLRAEADPVMTEKATSDAAALARAIAQARGRNASWAERAVRESVSSTAKEALRDGVIDLVAGDLETLLQELEGRKVTTTAGEITLRTSGAQVVQSSMRLPERILHAITDPNIAYLLFTLGLIGLAAELYSPGLFFPGLIGAVSLILAFVAFGSLPLNWAGLVLIVLAVGLFIAELLTEGFGILGVGGVVAFLLGSLMLYSPPGEGSPLMPAMRVSPWLIGVMATVIAGFFLLVMRAVLRARRTVVTTGIQGLIGSIGVATSELAPKGTVHLKSEEWRAKTVGEPIHAGEEVKVTGVEGVTLMVTRPPPVATA